MSVDWGTYSPYDPGVNRPLHELSRREARVAFDRLMASKAERVEELRRLLADNGIQLSSTDSGVQDLNDWFRSEVEGNGDADGRLRSVWYSVVNDVALFLGDEIISRYPNLHWSFFEKGSKNVAFQRHVVMGFTEVANPNYNVDIDLLVATYGHRIAAGQQVEKDVFWQWLRAAGSKA